MSTKIMERVELTLPDSLLDEYREQAEAANVPVEELLAQRLDSCKTHSATKGIYFNDKQRQRLQSLTGGTVLSDAEDALSRIESAQSFWVALPNGDATQVDLHPNLLSRLKTRCFGSTLGDLIKTETVHGLERFVGMR